MNAAIVKKILVALRNIAMATMTAIGQAHEPVRRYDFPAKPGW